MSSSKDTATPLDLSSLKIQDNDIVSQADKRAESLNRFSLLADKIQPKLSLDGSNFNIWSRSMIDTWASCFFGDCNYFDSNERDSDYRRNLVALSFIRNSIDRSLFQSIISQLYMPNARLVYQSLKKRFGKSSWSAIVQQARCIFVPTDQSSNLINHLVVVQGALNDLQSQIGIFTPENLLPIILYFSAPQLQGKITTALNTRKAINPSIEIYANDIIDIASWVPGKHIPEDLLPLQISRIEGSRSHEDRPHKDRSQHPGNQTPFNSPKTPITGASIQNQSPEWKKKWLTAQNPCFYCGGSGHWAPTCPVKAKAEQARRQQSKNALVAQLGVVPTLENGEGLLDSGAIHSVVGNISLFTQLAPANMSLSVASRHRFNVDGIGTIRLNTPNGVLNLSNVLYCKAIPGIVLSMGRLAEDGIDFFFLRNKLFLHHHNIFIACFFHNFQWFLPLLSTPLNSTSVSIKPISADNPPPINLATKPGIGSEAAGNLWHRRLGHLSIRNIKRLSKYQAAEGLPLTSLATNNICHHCSVSKSEHQPISALSRQHVLKPGDLVVADMIGPLPPSYDDKKYVLVIQDFFSRLTAAIPLRDKSEAKTHFIDWMRRFTAATGFKIRAIRTDNGSEFKKNILSSFLLAQGITHETSIPYERHQNGRVERTNRSILEIARTSLISAGIPKRLWPFAFKHAAFIFNR
ncbi:hypothetical protein O181_076152, partial [Austropuccinia psidii MF-1]|nr:hypothetical protein [Austropuccinia psidii MF-1]